MSRLKIKFYLYRESSGNIFGKNIFTHITYSYVGNAGDTVLSKCVRDCFRKYFDIRKWKLNSFTQEVNATLIKNINNTSMLIIGGGGVFLPDTHPNNISAWQWAVSEELLAEIKVPVIVFSVGYNYFRGHEQSELFKKSVAALVKKSAFFGLRNTGSVRAIQKILPAELHSKVIYQPCTTTIIRQLYDKRLKAKPDRPGKLIALNMAFDRPAMRFGDNQEKILDQCALAAKALEKKGYEIFYVCHCGIDREFVPYLIKHDVSFTIKDFSQSFPYEVIDFYNSIDFAAGMRGHAQMIPFGVNTDILSLASHDKMLWFCEDIQAPDWCIELTNDTDNLCGRIIDKFEDIHERNHELTRERLITQQQRLYNITLDNMKLINACLSKSQS